MNSPKPGIAPPGDSARQRIIDDYFRTTSSPGVGDGAKSFERSMAALRRRLGPWLDVRDKDVVDLGSGTGELCALACATSARSVVGVNLSQGEIEFARGHCAAEFAQSDVCTYLDGRPPLSTDRIYALNLLEHLNAEELLHVVERSFSCLRAGGTLTAMVPNATSPFGSMTRYWDITHQAAFTPSSVRQVARLAGFAECSFRECGPIPHGPSSAVRYVLWQGIRVLILGYLLTETGSSKDGIYSADMLFRLEKSR